MKSFERDIDKGKGLFVLLMESKILSILCC